MRTEKIIWWILSFLFLAGSILIFFHLLALGVIVTAYPEFTAFFVGLLGFWLFANRLIFAYGSLANTAAAFLKGKKFSKEDILAKAKQSTAHVENLSIGTILALWQNMIEPYKYAYYLAFFLVFVCAMLFEMDLLGGGLPAIAAKGLMMGASIPSLLVFVLDILADHYVTCCLKVS